MPPPSHISAVDVSYKFRAWDAELAAYGFCADFAAVNELVGRVMRDAEKLLEILDGQEQRKFILKMYSIFGGFHLFSSSICVFNILTRLFHAKDQHPRAAFQRGLFRVKHLFAAIAVLLA